jgi:hypothetical protein
MSPQYELIMRSVAQNTISEEKLFENFGNDVHIRSGTTPSLYTYSINIDVPNLTKFRYKYFHRYIGCHK